MGKGWQPPKAKGCQVCSKAVYHMEKIEADEKIYHKTCFKCAECKKSLSAGSYAAMNGVVYCKPHFKQLFKTKGNYNFGSDAPATPSSFSVNIKPSAQFNSPSSNSTASFRRTKVAKAEAPSTVERKASLTATAKPTATVTETETKETETKAAVKTNKTTTTTTVAGVTTGPRASFSQGPQGFNAIHSANKGHFAATAAPTHVVKCDVTPAKKVIAATGGVAAIAARFASLSSTASTPASTPASLRPTTSVQRRRSSAKIEAVMSKLERASSEQLNVSKPATPAATKSNTTKPKSGKSVLAAVALFEKFNTTAESSPVSLRPKHVFNGTLAGESNTAAASPCQSAIKTRITFTEETDNETQETPAPAQLTSTVSSHSFVYESSTKATDAGFAAVTEEQQGGSAYYDLSEETEGTEETQEDFELEFEACDGVLDEDEADEATEEPGDLKEVERRLSRRLSSLLNVSDAFDVDMANLSITNDENTSTVTSPSKPVSRKNSFALEAGVPTPLGRRLSSMMNISEFMDSDLTNVTSLQVA
eukprot:m.163695 g.163695  ORF g.163695 m.163695 type:complete len:536 (-) comp16559_c0_seq1:1913-3520(-)